MAVDVIIELSSSYKIELSFFITQNLKLNIQKWISYR